MAETSLQAADMMIAAPAAAPEPQEDIVEASSFNASLMVLLIVLWSSCGHMLASRTKYLGEGSAACGMGLIMGVFILIIQKYLSEDAVHNLLTFNPADFFVYLLPPIIFYAGLSVKKKHFFRNFPTISAFGILGTYVAFAVIALALYAVAQLPNSLNLSDCLALGVIFAATDSVAVLQVLQQDRMPLLYSLVFGEGVINDATSVALLRAVQDLGVTSAEPLHFSTILTVFAKFIYLFAASLLLGLVFGLGTSWLLKVSKANSTPQEVTLLGLLGYLSYLTGDFMGFSGIVALFCCAVTISHYALHNVSSLSRVTTVSAFQTLSYVSEGAIFIYVGMDALDPIKWKNTVVLEMSWLFVVLLLLMGVGRAVFVFPLTLLHNWWSSDQLSTKDAIVIWWAGLIRGAVSVALVYYHFDPHGKSEDSKRATLITTTLLLVLFSIMVCGALTKPLLDFMLGPDALTQAGLKPSSSSFARSSRTLNGQVYANLDQPDRSTGSPTLHGDSPHSVAESPFVVDLKSQRPRLLGSLGQDLVELAENAQPAMVAAAHAPEPNAVKGSFVVTLPSGIASAPAHSPPSSLARTSPQENGFVRQRRSPHEQDEADFFGEALSEAGGGGGHHRTPTSVSGGMNGDAGPSAAGDALAELRRSPHATDSRLSIVTNSSPGPRDAWQPPGQASEGHAHRSSMMSPFETEHAQSSGQELGDGGFSGSLLWRASNSLDRQNVVSSPRLTSGSLDGQVHRWWSSFDARVMQPLFGGPRQDGHGPVAVLQPEGNVNVVVSNPQQNGAQPGTRQRVQVPLSRVSFR
ncbi:hypothetical protein WJX73_001939 [Symbiochloris irregularis]|uniref:Cation/H+ exchanger transmembrane domain-containing protein n=1 Tax=Symbiochloris irregularis TaxID=706552 RepID=A0AAW1NZ49_9CHLO